MMDMVLERSGVAPPEGFTVEQVVAVFGDVLPLCGCVVRGVRWTADGFRDDALARGGSAEDGDAAAEAVVGVLAEYLAGVLAGRV